MKILILQFSSVGDLVLATPVIRILKSDLEHTVHFVTKKAFTSSLIANPYLDKIYELDRSVNQLVKDLKKENYDLIIDLENSFKTKFIRYRLGRKSLAIRNFPIRKWFKIFLNIDLLPNKHLVDRNLKVIRPIGGKMDNLGLDYFIPEKDEIEDDWIPKTHRNGFAVVALNGKYFTNKLPADRLIELCDRINKPIILLGESEDVEKSIQLEKFFTRGSDREEKEIEELNKKTLIFNACGKFSINQSASVIAKANWVFTHDNDLMHIAAAFKKPIFSIWGNTIPSFGKYPFRTQFTIFENNKIGCRPCSSTGFNKCPKGHFKCMKELTFDFYLPD